MRNLVLLAGVVLSLAAASSAQARTVPEVQRFLKEEMLKLETVAPQGPIVRPTEDALGDYVLSLFRLRVQAEFGFDVGVAKVTLVPMAEFFWE